MSRQLARLLVVVVSVGLATSVGAQGRGHGPGGKKAGAEKPGGSQAVDEAVGAVVDEALDAVVDELVGDESAEQEARSGLPPGLSKKGKLPPGLEKQGKIPEGWSKGKKAGWQKEGGDQTPTRKEGFLRRVFRDIFRRGKAPAQEPESQ